MAYNSLINLVSYSLRSLLAWLSSMYALSSANMLLYSSMSTYRAYTMQSDFWSQKTYWPDKIYPSKRHTFARGRNL
jgi:hypothetical protein